MKKKTLLLTLALCTVFSFSACSQDKKVDDSLRGTVSAASGEASTVDSSEAESSEADVATESTEEATESTDAAESSVEDSAESVDGTEASTENADVADDSEAEALTLGHSDASSYESTFLGIGCKFDSNWTFMTDEQIQENNKAAAELINNKTVSNALEDGTVLTDMMVQNSATGSNVIVAIEKIHTSMKNITEEQYVDFVATQLVATLEASGFSNVSTEKITTTFLGSDHVALKITSTVSSTTVNQIQIPVKKGEYMACITASAFGDNTVDEMVDAFYSLD